MKNILGLDLGTNSIGWAVVNGSVNDNGSEQLVKIQASGSRIIPMDAAMIGDFNKGNSISQTAGCFQWFKDTNLKANHNSNLIIIGLKITK